MRIGIDARFYGSIGKGLGRYTEKLIAHLETIDDVNEYVVFLRRENFDAYRPGSPRFTKQLADYPWYGFSEQVLFPLLLLRSRLDLVHFPHFNVPFFYWRPFVVTIHDLILLRFPTMRNTTLSPLWYRCKYVAYRLVIASAIHRARCIFAVSDFTARDIVQRYPVAEEKIVVTKEATEERCFVSSRKEEGELFRRLSLLEEPIRTDGRAILKTYFLYVGNAYPHKNLELILDAAERFPSVCFVFVGKRDYFYDRLRMAARKRKLRNVVFAGFVSDAGLDMLYRCACGYLFPSLYEGFGLPPLEAMRCGTPVVAARTGSLPEVLGDAVLFFDPESPEEWYAHIGRLMDDASLREELRSKGYRRVRMFSWDRMVIATLRGYRSVLASEETHG